MPICWEIAFIVHSKIYFLYNCLLRVFFCIWSSRIPVIFKQIYLTHRWDPDITPSSTQIIPGLLIWRFAIGCSLMSYPGHISGRLIHLQRIQSAYSAIEHFISYENLNDYFSSNAIQLQIGREIALFSKIIFKCIAVMKNFLCFVIFSGLQLHIKIMRILIYISKHLVRNYDNLFRAGTKDQMKLPPPLSNVRDIVRPRYLTAFLAVPQC